MSKISQTRKEIKKKLSFNDYSTPTDQYDVIKEDQHPVIPAVHHNDLQADLYTSRTGDSISNLNIVSANQSVSVPAPSKQHDSVSVHHENSQSTNQASKPDDDPACHHGVHAEKKARKQKLKATYYLSQHELEMVTHLYIKQLKKTNKGDKSAIICEAIRLIYERDK